jgi:hypothetical protein
MLAMNGPLRSFNLPTEWDLGTFFNIPTTCERGEQGESPAGVGLHTELLEANQGHN